MKSKTIYIITLNGYFNFGNRLQNYALTRYLSLLNYNVYTYWEKNIIDKIKISIKLLSPIKEHKRFKKIFLYSKKYGKAFSGAFLQRMFLPSAFPYFCVSFFTDNDFMRPVKHQIRSWLINLLILKMKIFPEEYRFRFPFQNSFSLLWKFSVFPHIPV